MGGEVRNGPKASTNVVKGAWLGSKAPRVGVPPETYTMLGDVGLWNWSRLPTPILPNDVAL